MTYVTGRSLVDQETAVKLNEKFSRLTRLDFTIKNQLKNQNSDHRRTTLTLNFYFPRAYKFLWFTETILWVDIVYSQII